DCSPPRALEPAFANPICSEDFLQRVRQEKVCLEGVLVDGFWLRGTVRVLNVAFRKEVTVRHTLDEWRSYCDTVATYLPPAAALPTPGLGADPQTDRFAFQLALPPYLEGRGLQLAVRYRAGGHGEYWDNDRGRNYRLCPPPRRRLSPPPPQDTDGSWVHFV
ncbi:hypothetical protein chiPu_0030180, partial [Chiloscyllium punctatum]|nr:hypothetical protein [Chiloscyllium punctatum]